MASRSRCGAAFFAVVVFVALMRQHKASSNALLQPPRSTGVRRFATTAAIGRPDSGFSKTRTSIPKATTLSTASGPHLDITTPPNPPSAATILSTSAASFLWAPVLAVAAIFGILVTRTRRTGEWAVAGAAAADLKWRPLNGRVLIEPIKNAPASPGGLLLMSETEREESTVRGRVAAVGSATSLVTVGAPVLYPKAMAEEVTLDGQVYTIVREDDLLGVFE